MMKKSESIKNLAAALVKFQAEVNNPSNTANNPYFNSKYAPLNEILNEVRPKLSKHGLAVMQFPAGDGQNITCTTVIVHESGEWIEAEPLTLRADKVNAQGAGSAVTYARRYSLSALLGISSEDDDDGNHASKTGQKPSHSKPKGVKKESKGNGESDKITENQIRAVFALAKKANVDEEYIKAEYKVDSVKNLTKAQASEIITQLQQAN